MSNKTNENSPQPKGRPSGTERESSGLKETRSDELERDEEIANKYTDGPDHPAPNVKEEHPNRNTDKGRENQGRGSTSN